MIHQKTHIIVMNVSFVFKHIYAHTHTTAVLFTKVMSCLYLLIGT